MDIERMKKLLTSGIEAGNKVKEVRKVIKTYKTQKQDMYDDTAEILKPSIEVQKKVKATIDEKQNKLIEKLQENKETVDKKQDEVIQQLKENQVELSKSIDTLSEIMSQSGSQSGVKQWLSGLPSEFEPLDIIGEEGEGGVEEPKSLLDPAETEIIKKYGFDPTLQNIPSETEVKKKLSGTTGKKNSKNPIIKNLAEKDTKHIFEISKNQAIGHNTNSLWHLHTTKTKRL